MNADTNTLHGPIPAYSNAKPCPPNRDGRWLDLQRSRAFDERTWSARSIEGRAVWAGPGWTVDLCRDQDHDDPEPLFRVFAGPSLCYRGSDHAMALSEWARLAASQPHWLLKRPRG